MAGIFLTAFLYIFISFMTASILYMYFLRFVLYFTLFRVYSGSEFVVANTLAKWKKLEPNEINFSQEF